VVREDATPDPEPQPRRLGLARARAAAGDIAGSRKAYEQFLQNWRNADPNLPEIKEARTALGR
jgi:hypothetical protein